MDPQSTFGPYRTSPVDASLVPAAPPRPSVKLSRHDKIAIGVGVGVVGAGLVGLLFWRLKRRKEKAPAVTREHVSSDRTEAPDPVWTQESPPPRRSY